MKKIIIFILLNILSFQLLTEESSKQMFDNYMNIFMGKDVTNFEKYFNLSIEQPEYEFLGFQYYNGIKDYEVLTVKEEESYSELEVQFTYFETDTLNIREIREKIEGKNITDYKKYPIIYVLALLDDNILYKESTVIGKIRMIKNEDTWAFYNYDGVDLYFLALMKYSSLLSRLEQIGLVE